MEAVFIIGGSRVILLLLQSAPKTSTNLLLMAVTLSGLWAWLIAGNTGGLEMFSGFSTVISSCYAGWQFWKKWRETKGIRAVKEALEKEPKLRREHRDDQEKEVMLSMLDRAAELGPLVRERLLNRLVISLGSILLLVVAMFTVRAAENSPSNHIDVMDFVFALLQLAIAHSNRSGKLLLGEVEQVFFRNTAALQAWFYEAHVIPALKDFNHWASGQNLLAPYVVAEKSADAARADWVKQALRLATRESRDQEEKQQWKRECLQCGTSVLAAYDAKAELPTQEWLMVNRDQEYSFERNVEGAGYMRIALTAEQIYSDPNGPRMSRWEFPGHIHPPLYVLFATKVMFAEAWSEREIFTSGKMAVVVPNIRHLLSIRMLVASVFRERDDFELGFCQALVAAKPDAISDADWVEMASSYGLHGKWMGAIHRPRRASKPGK